MSERDNVFRIFFVIIITVAFLAAAYKPAESWTGLKKFSSPEELINFVKSGTGGYGGYRSGATLAAADQAPASSQKTEDAGSPDYSTTNVQVAGVDEADIVKNDGRYIYAVSGSSVAIIDAYPAENADIVSVINLTGSGNPQNLYINGDRLVVFGNVHDYGARPLKKPAEMPSPGIIPPFPSSFIKIYDITDRSNPVLKADMHFNGTYSNSRMIGDYVYAVITMPAYFSEGEVLPSFSPEQKGFPEIYYSGVPDSAYQFTNIVSARVSDSSFTGNKVFLLGSSDALYVSKDSIYLAYPKRVEFSDAFERTVNEAVIPSVSAELADRIKAIMNSGKPSHEKRKEVSEAVRKWLESLNPEEAARITKNAEEKYAEMQRSIAKETDKSVIHKISISSGNIEYKAKGEVPGKPLNQFSMDEHNGYFRIATTTDQSGPLNHVYVLDGGMNIAGKLEDLAPGERIFSARFTGDRAYLVTFVRMDPLFVIDLKDPAKPRVLGELKIPGVSDYIHPYDENHIIGVGRSTEDSEGRALFKGLKISLFDVTDVSNPKEVAKYEIGERGTDSEALHDHKAFLFSKEKNLLVIPVLLAEPSYQYSWQGAYVFGVTAQNLSLRGRIAHDAGEPQKEFYYPRYPVRRSLYIGNALYTISNAMVKANSLDTLEEIKSVNLPAGR
ncbi:MAG: beta-propeller domain-containing protein [Candidatus Aenigmarchaeota archaeon]|nr:beta-propeller domain-containing protein [Candidatus Aenigmarchaeota archaeon]